ncbi:MAG: hypothetical protein Q9195_007692 [Heterodermia aff. obscurata]
MDMFQVLSSGGAHVPSKTNHGVELAARTNKASAYVGRLKMLGRLKKAHGL